MQLARRIYRASLLSREVVLFFVSGSFLLAVVPGLNAGPRGALLRIGVFVARYVLSWAVIWLVLWWLAPTLLVGSRAGAQTVLQVLPAVIVAILVLGLGSLFVVAQIAVATWGTRSPVLLIQDEEVIASIAKPLVITVITLLLAGQVPDDGQPGGAATAAFTTLILATARFIPNIVALQGLILQRYTLPRGFPMYVVNDDVLDREIDAGHLGFVVYRGPMLQEMAKLAIRRGDSTATVATVEAIDRFHAKLVDAAKKDDTLWDYGLNDGSSRPDWLADDVTTALVDAGEELVRLGGSAKDSNLIARTLAIAADRHIQTGDEDGARRCADGLVEMATTHQQIAPGVFNVFAEPVGQLSWLQGRAEAAGLGDVATDILAGWALGAAYARFHLGAEQHPMVNRSLRNFGPSPEWHGACGLIIPFESEWRRKWANKVEGNVEVLVTEIIAAADSHAEIHGLPAPDFTGKGHQLAARNVVARPRRGSKPEAERRLTTLVRGTAGRCAGPIIVAVIRSAKVDGISSPTWTLAETGPPSGPRSHLRLVGSSGGSPAKRLQASGSRLWWDGSGGCFRRWCTSGMAKLLHMVEARLSTDFAILNVHQGVGIDAGPFAISVPGGVALTAGEKNAEMEVRVESWDGKPVPAAEEWEERDVLPWRSLEGETQAGIDGFDPANCDPIDLTGLDVARVEVLAWGRNRYSNAPSDEELRGIPPERWLLRFWPDPEALDAMAGPPRRLVERDFLGPPPSGYAGAIDALTRAGWPALAGSSTPLGAVFEAIRNHGAPFAVHELPPTYREWTLDTEIDRSALDSLDEAEWGRADALAQAAGIQLQTYRDALDTLVALGVLATVSTPTGSKLVPNPAPPINAWDIVEAPTTGHRSPDALRFERHSALSQDLLHLAQWVPNEVLRATPHRIASRLGVPSDDVVGALRLLAALGHDLTPTQPGHLDPTRPIALSVHPNT